MLLYLINPFNSLVNLSNVKASRWNHYRIWKPLGLMVLAALTPENWEVKIFDENQEVPDYSKLPRPDMVGVGAFTSQATRAYEVAKIFKDIDVPVIMGGIHATMCPDEALEHFNCVVTGEAEEVWPDVLRDFEAGELKELYTGSLVDITKIPSAKQDLLKDFAFGSIQTTRGCPLNCKFCSVTAFNGNQYRRRPIPDVIKELASIREKRILIVDDNLIGTAPAHIQRAKELFQAIIDSKIKKKWIAQVTINFADDEELMKLARRAGCRGIFIGFESPDPGGLCEIGKKFNMLRERNFKDSVKRIKNNKMLVVGSFIMGLDVDKPGIGRHIAKTAKNYGVDIMNAIFLTPLPGTQLWNEMKDDNRIKMNNFPHDWKYYTLGYPTASYKHFSTQEIIREMNQCDGKFYSILQIIKRLTKNFLDINLPLVSLVSNISYRLNARMAKRTFRRMRKTRTVFFT